MEDEYIVNKNTYALLPTSNGTKIINFDDEIDVLVSTNILVSNSCRYYGSSLEGRIIGTRDILGVNYKPPIMISEVNNFIMFPTESVRSVNCAWINLGAIKRYYRKNMGSSIVFLNNKEVDFDISYPVLDKQILKASRLYNISINRRGDIY